MHALESWRETSPFLCGEVKELSFVCIRTNRIICCISHGSHHANLPLSLLLPDHTLTVHNVATALATVKDWRHLFILFGILGLRRDKIEGQHSTPDQLREAAISWWLSMSPYASWQWLAGRLYNWGKKNALEAVIKYFQVPAGMRSV